MPTLISYARYRYFCKRHGWGPTWVSWLWLDAILFAVARFSTLHSPFFNLEMPRTEAAEVLSQFKIAFPEDATLADPQFYAHAFTLALRREGLAEIAVNVDRREWINKRFTIRSPYSPYDLLD